MFTTRSLTLAAAIAGFTAFGAVATPAGAGPGIVPDPGPVTSYYMGDSLNCFIDVRLTIEDQADGRQSAFVEPLGIRSTIPGMQAPTQCSATLGATWNDERNPMMRFGSVRVDAAPDRSDRARLDLDVQPGSQWTSLSYIPASMALASYGAFPALSTAVTHGTLPG
ncbi:hypothetical protein ACFC06_13945 [Nocardia sp. NPDC056064]|uniref:hypothetical protein n=1 Tax=Nocardia sp. NPDC056064 TaxID=3345701 RepID=UPI0035D7EA1F